MQVLFLPWLRIHGCTVHAALEQQVDADAQCLRISCRCAALSA